jgi:hypothetical protein
MEGVESTPYPEATETRMGVISGLAIQHFAARGGDLVHLVYLVYLVFLVYLVRRTRETRQTRAPDRLPLNPSSSHTTLPQHSSRRLGLGG